MATSGNKSVQLCMPKAKAAVCTGLYTYSNGIVEACLPTKKKMQINDCESDSLDKSCFKRQILKSSLKFSSKAYTNFDYYPYPKSR